VIRRICVVSFSEILEGFGAVKVVLEGWLGVRKRFFEDNLGDYSRLMDAYNEPVCVVDSSNQFPLTIHLNLSPLICTKCLNS
jgi:hypothetical protein